MEEELNLVDVLWDSTDQNKEKRKDLYVPYFNRAKERIKERHRSNETDLIYQCQPATIDEVLERTGFIQTECLEYVGTELQKEGFLVQYLEDKLYISWDKKLLQLYRNARK